MTNLFGWFGKLILWNLCWYFLCHLFAFHDSTSARVHCSCLLLYQTFNFFFPESAAFTRIATCAKQERSFRIVAASSRYVMRKVWIRVLWILHFVVYLSSEEVLQGLSKNNPTKKQIDAEIQVTLKNAPPRKRTEEKMFYRLLQQITKPNYRLTLLASACVFHKFCCLDYLLFLLL